MSRKQIEAAILNPKFMPTNPEKIKIFRNLNANGNNIDLAIVRASDTDREKGGVFLYDLGIDRDAKERRFALAANREVLFPDATFVKHFVRIRSIINDDGDFSFLEVTKNKDGWEPKPDTWIYPSARKAHFKSMTEDDFNKAINWLTDHEYTDVTNEGELDTAVRNLVNRQNESGYLKFNGVAGSGKTEVLAHRTINALKKGHRVLFVTFNITLIRAIIGRINALASIDAESEFLFAQIRKNLSVSTYHRLMTSTVNQAFDDDNQEKSELNNQLNALFNNQQIHPAIDDVNYEGWMDIPNVFSNENLSPLLTKHLNELVKFDDVLIDEGQDFLKAWQSNLRAYFWNGAQNSGSFVLSGDLAQNMYGRDKEDSQVATIIPGQWDGSLNRNYRAIGDYEPQAQSVFKALANTPIAASTLQSEFLHDITEKFSNVHVYEQKITNMQSVKDSILTTVNKYNTDGSVAILFDSLNSLSEDILALFSQTSRTKWTKAENKLKYGRDDIPDFSAKYSFYPSHTMLSTVNSFKGHQADTIAYYYSAKNKFDSERAISRFWVALTRAKKRIIFIPVNL